MTIEHEIMTPLQNVGNHLPSDRAPHHTKPESSTCLKKKKTSLLLKPYNVLDHVTVTYFYVGITL